MLFTVDFCRSKVKRRSVPGAACLRALALLLSAFGAALLLLLAPQWLLVLLILMLCAALVISVSRR